MKLELSTQVIELTRIDLILSLNSVPKLRFLTTEKFDSSIILDITASNERATLSWQEEEIEVLPYGFEENPEDANEGESYIYTLLLEKDLEAWFTTKIDSPTDLSYGIYQNQSEVGGWTFLNSCLAHQVLVPINDYKERIDKILPTSTCLIRPIYQDNQQYLETLLNQLQQHIPELVGWTAIHAKEEALRFIFFDKENAFNLDETWENLSVTLPNRFTNKTKPIKIQKTGQQIKSGSNMFLLKELSQYGLTTPLEDVLADGGEDQLLYLPGPVTLAEKLYLCETLTYSFKLESNMLTTTLSLSSGQKTISNHATPSKLEGKFKNWDADDDNEKRVFLTPPSPATWQLIDPKDSNLLKPDADLMASFLVPTTPKDNYSELYIRRVEGDTIVFKSQSFHSPTIYGSKQKLAEKQEAATLSLNTETLILNQDKKDTSINDIKGIIADKKTIMQRLNTEVKLETTTITQAKNAQIKEDKLSIVSKTDIAKKTTAKNSKVTGVPSGAFVSDAGISYNINVNKIGSTGLTESLNNQETRDLEPDVINAYWASSIIRRDETAILRGITRSHPDGTPASFKIYELSESGSEEFMTELSGELRRNTAYAEWPYSYTKDTNNLNCIPEGDETYHPPTYIFDLEVAGKTVRSDQMQLKDTIDITLKNKKGKLIKNRNFTAIFADGTEKRARTDENGFVQLTDIPPGKVHINFRKKHQEEDLEKKITNAIWESDYARENETVHLYAQTQGFPTSTPVKLHIYESDDDGEHDFITTLDAEINNNQIRSQWDVVYQKDDDDLNADGRDAPEYFFQVEVEDKKRKSDILEFRDWIEIELLDDEDNVVPNAEFIVKFADGTEQRGFTDEQGKAKLIDVPSGEVDVQFV